MARTSQKTMTNQTDNATVTTTTKVVDNDAIGKFYNGPFGIEYTGARYVSIFADPIEWNKDTAYEHLVVVLYQGASYVSKCYVPAGIDITDEHYWLRTFDFDAQVELYRQKVEEIDERTKDLDENLTKKINNNYYQVYPTDSQEEIQKVLNSNSAVKFMPGNYTLNCNKGNNGITGLEINDGQVIWFDNCTINMNATTSGNYYMFLAENKNNIHLFGNSTIIGDKDNHLGNTGEWGMCIGIIGCKNVTIEDLILTKGWGDGLYIDNGLNSNFITNNVLIKNVKALNNSRNGLSIIGGENIEVSGGEYSYSDRTAPMCGIDVEPNAENSRYKTCKSISIHDAVLKNNKTGAILCVGINPNMDVYVHDCKAINSGYHANNRNSKNNFVFENIELYYEDNAEISNVGLVAENVDPNSFITFNNVKVKAQNKTDSSVRVITIVGQKIVNAYFTNLHVFDGYIRRFVYFERSVSKTLPGTVFNISGILDNVTVWDPTTWIEPFDTPTSPGKKAKATCYMNVTNTTPWTVKGSEILTAENCSKIIINDSSNPTAAKSIRNIGIGQEIIIVNESESQLDIRPAFIYSVVNLADGKQQFYVDAQNTTQLFIPVGKTMYFKCVDAYSAVYILADNVTPVFPS